MDIIDEYFRLYSIDKMSAALYMMKHSSSFTTKNLTDYFDSKDQKFYFYLVTFTLKPTSLQQADLAEAYIRAQFTDRPALQVVEAHYVRELTKNGVPHWHVAVKTTKPLAKDRFNYYENLFGQTDVSKNKHKNLNDALNYISKSGTPTKLV